MTEAIDGFTQYRQEMMQHVPHMMSHVDRDQQTLVVENLRLVVPIAFHYATVSSLPLLDLIQEGNLGLMRAAQDYEPSTSSFSNYATWWIKAFIRLALYRDTTSVTISVEKAQLVQKIRQYLHAHPDVSLSGLAEAMGLSMDEAVALLALAQGVASLDTRVREDDEETTLADFLEADPEASNPESVVMTQATSASIDQLLAVLLKQEREVIELRYGLDGKEPLTQEETGRILHMSRNGVRAAEERAMMKLQRHARVTHFYERIA